VKAEKTRTPFISLAKGIAAAALVIAATLVPSNPGAEVIDRVVAIINDDIITLSELNAATALATDGIDEADGKDAESTTGLKKDVLESLVERRLVKQAADRAGIDVSEIEIDNAVEEVSKQNKMTHEALLVALANSGLTYKEYREQLREQIREVKFVNNQFRSRISIQPEEVEDYYRQNIEEFYGPPTYRIRMILVKANDSEAEELKLKTIYEEVRGGEDFGELARQYSNGPNASTGGDLGYLGSGEMDPAIEEAVKGLEPGQTSEAIKKPEGTYIIQLVDKRDEEPLPLKEVEGRIFEKLFNRAMEERFKTWLEGVKKFAHIEIRF